MNKQNIVNKQKATIKLAKMGMLVAISVILVFIHFPIFPATPFLEYDPADIPILVGTFAFGPIAGLMIAIVAAVVQGVTVSAASGIYGIVMHILATGTFVLVAGLIYKGNKTRKRAAIGIICGALAMTAIMIPANLIVTPLFTGTPREAIVALLPFIIGFNLIKAGVNGAITFIIYKKISKLLNK